MINKLILKNFRNFENSEFLFCEQKNFIIWENGKWKTNILEAISLLSTESINNIDFDNLVWNNWDIFYIQIKKYNQEIISISYDKTNKKKIYTINWKNTIKAKIKAISDKLVLFSPITMNIMYLSPSLRRDFLDQILLNTFDLYSKATKEYKNILKNRNKTLKAINQGKAQENELDFWDEKFTYISEIIYNYRFWIRDFFVKNIKNTKKCFFWKIKNIEFIYKTKIKNDIKNDIKSYLKENRKKDIILKTTSIWPHIDDFDILLDWKSLINFASRWETKSVIIELKFIEKKFIEHFTKQKPILLIDDLLSELDEKHKNMILNEISWYQCFITGINEKEINSSNKILL